MRSACKSYRHLLLSANKAVSECNLPDGGGVVKYLAERFRSISEKNRRAQVKKKHLVKQLALVDHFCETLTHAPNFPELVSMLRVLGAGVGSPAYQRAIEKGLVDYVAFQQQQQEREEVDEDSTSERQNRLLQHALQPYIEKLAIIQRPGISDHDIRGLLSSGRGECSVNITTFGEKEKLVVEVDNELNKQTVYCVCPDFDWAAPLERVEVREMELLRKAIAHSDYASIADRYFQAATLEAPLHKGRTTVVVGHAVGGAVALLVGLVLHALQFDVRNVVTFGAPKPLQTVLQRDVTAVNAIRLVIGGDSRVEMPVSTDDANPFVHIGEILILERPVDYKSSTVIVPPTPSEPKKTAEEILGDMMSDEAQDEADDDEADVPERPAPDPRLFTVEEYLDHMKDASTVLTYAEGDDVWDVGDYSTWLLKAKQTEVRK